MNDRNLQSYVTGFMYSLTIYARASDDVNTFLRASETDRTTLPSFKQGDDAGRSLSAPCRAK